MLRLRCVAGVRVHDQLSIGELLGQEKRIDWHDDNVFVSMYNQRWLANLAQHGKAVLRGDCTPFADGFQLHAK